MGHKVSCEYTSGDAYQGTELISMTQGNVPCSKKDMRERRRTAARRSPFLFVTSKAVKQASQRALERFRRLRCRLSGCADPAVPMLPTVDREAAALRRREAYLLRLGIPRQSQARGLGCKGKIHRSCRPITNSFRAACVDANRKASECLELTILSTDTPRSRGDSLCSESSSRSRFSSTSSDASSLDGHTMLFESEKSDDSAATTDIQPSQAQADSQARMKFLQKLSYERVWVPKPQRPPSHQTVIIFDWDDTLLCTSFLLEVQAITLPAVVLDILQDIEHAVMNLLSLSLSLGHTFIITNAVKGWVEHSTAKHLPGILPLLERVRVVSARSRYAASFPNEVGRWKEEAFLEVQRQLDSQVVTNVVSLGDSHFEMDAALAMGRQFEQATIKTVKFQGGPSPEELLKQQQVVCKEFEKIVGNARNLRVRVVAPSKQSSRSEQSAGVPTS